MSIRRALPQLRGLKAARAKQLFEALWQRLDPEGRLDLGRRLALAEDAERYRTRERQQAMTVDRSGPSDQKPHSLFTRRYPRNPLEDGM